MSPEVNNLAKELSDVIYKYQGEISLAEAVGALEIVKLEIYDSTEPLKDDSEV